MKGETKTAGESYVYIVECADGTLYTGWTSRPLQRLAAHNAGKGAKYTRGRGPVLLVYLEKLEDKSAGLIREAQIKKLNVVQKRRLILKQAECSAGLKLALEKCQGERAGKDCERTSVKKSKSE